jgi:hypothetical protein
MLQLTEMSEAHLKATHRRRLDATNTTDINRISECQRRAFAHEVIDRICLAQYLPEFATTKKFRCIRPQLSSEHVCELCDDFGPPSIAFILSFIELLDNELSSHPSCKIVVCIEDGRRALTLAVFLLGAYMILKQDTPADELLTSFSWLRSGSLVPFRHASAPLPGIPLSPLDCWRALGRARALGWVHPVPDAQAHVAAIPAGSPAGVEGRCGEPGAPAGAPAGLCLMRRHGFAAREAVGLLGIMRPGSAADREQRGLCGVTRPRRRLGAFIPCAAHRGVSAAAG